MNTILPAYLEKYQNNENVTVYKDYTTDGIAKLLQALGNPQAGLACVHIAGTNGKGSTALYTEHLFRSAGYKTGLFTSPHLASICERIRINGEMISEDDFLRCSREAEEAAAKLNKASLTFFDMVTASAFLYFKACATDIAIIETGLGGRRDSTNSVTPLCSIITGISLDHTAVLGNTVEQIAKEKAGIIKPNIPLVTSNKQPDILYVLREECTARQSKMFALGEDFTAGDIKITEKGFMYDYSCGETTLPNIKINSPVVEQIENSACGITACLILKKKYPRLAPNAFAEHLENFIPQGRFTTLAQNPIVVFDPAHNPAAMNSLLAAVARRYAGKKIISVVTFMSDKDYSTMLAMLQQACIKIIYYTLNAGRAYKPSINELSANTELYQNEQKLASIIKKENDGDTIFLFTGSFKLYDIALKTTKLLFA